MFLLEASEEVVLLDESQGQWEAEQLGREVQREELQEQVVEGHAGEDAGGAVELEPEVEEGGEGGEVAAEE